MRTLSLIAVLAIIALSGCATITSSETQAITVSTYTGDGERLDKARCTLRNDKGTWQVDTPGYAPVHRSSEDLMVECSKAGQPNGFARAISRAASAMYGNIVFGGIVGGIIDHTKGTGYDYPSFIIVRMGGSVVFDKRDERASSVASALPPSQLSLAAPAPQPPQPPQPPVAEAPKVAAADASLPASLPRPGDRWRYEYVDGYTGRRGPIFVHEVVRATKAEVDERMYVADRSAFADEHVFTFDVLQVLHRAVPGADRTEFAPYLQAFRPDFGLSGIGPISSASQETGAGWQYSARVVGQETVAVPAGMFDAIKIDISGRTTSARVAGSRYAGQVQHLIWYSPKVKRYVRYEYNSWSDSFGPIDKQRFELVDFKLN